MKVSPQIEQHLTANMDIHKKDIIIGNFLGGLAWGVGSVIGAIVVVAILGYLLKILGVFENIGTFLNELTNLNQQLRQMPRF